MTRPRGELESSVEDDVVAWAINRGWFVRKLKFLDRRGAPDHLFAKWGRLVFIEFKRPSRAAVADPLQAREHKRMRAAGLEVHVVNNRDDGVRALGGDRYVRD